jgi:hypothetical protein
MRGGVKSMYRKNPLRKKTCKLSDICCFTLYRIDVSLRKIPNSFILILPACISYARVDRSILEYSPLYFIDLLIMFVGCQLFCSYYNLP